MQAYSRITNKIEHSQLSTQEGEFLSLGNREKMLEINGC